jgi:tetratricopeptide (TPR) repeat protein
VIHKALVAGTAILMVTALSVSLASADPISESPVDPIANYSEAIDRVEAQQSAYATELADLYLSLGRAYVDRQDYQKAIGAFTKGLQIERINHGLQSLSQRPYLLSLAETEGLRGDWKQSRSALNNLYQINRQNYDSLDPRLLPVLDDILHWLLKTHRQQPTRTGYVSLITAERIGQNIDAILTSDLEADPQTASERYRQLAFLHYRIAEHISQYGDSNNSGISVTTTASLSDNTQSTSSHLHYQRGKAALEKVVEYRVKQDPDNILQQALAVAELGDWYLLFDRRKSAENAYRLASNTLKSGNQTPTEVALFDQPTMIAFSASHSIAKDGADHPQLEVTMTISAVGKISDIDVVSSEPILSQQQLKNLKRNLRSTRFRPKLADGIPVASAHRAFFPLSLVEG